MRKVLKFGLIVPLFVLLAVGTVSFAEGTEDLKDKPLKAKSLNAEDGRDDRSDAAETTSADEGRGEAAVLDGSLRGIESRRGRQARKGQAVQVEWELSDSNSGKSDDETPDEDEDPDVTPPGA